MKTRILTALSIIAIISFAACANASENNSNGKADSTDHTGHDHAKEVPASDTTAPAIVQVKDDMLNAVYQQYSNLTKALVASDMAKAKLAANAIETGAKEIKGASLVSAAANKIAAAKDLDAQRSAFSGLSNQLISLLKQSGMSSGKLYVDFCPMALNNKGAYWISGIKEIRNPYFGDKMLSCGEVKETLQ